MTVSEGQHVTLNDVTYSIGAYLGHGAVADVYLAQLLPGGETVALRLQKDGLARETVEEQGMQRETAVLERLNVLEDPAWPSAPSDPATRLRRAQQTVAERHIVALLDSGVDSQGRPFVVQELAPNAFQPIAIKTIADERRVMLVAYAIAKVLELCHDNQLTLKDFAPEGGKLNRIRVAWDDTGLVPTNIKMIDWNVTGGGSPELRAEDLFHFGGHLYTMFFRTQLALKDGKPSANLSIGTRGWEQITAGSRYIIQQLIYRRYQRARDLRADLQWWIETLSVNDASNLERRAWQVAPRPEQQLAVADLALRLQPQNDERQRFERIANQARDDLEKIDLLVLDPGLLNLRTGLYRRAVDEFSHILEDTHLSVDLARQARIYRNLAQFALMLRDAGIANPTADPSWREASEGAEMLRHGEWPGALQRFDPLVSRFNGQVDTSPIEQMRSLAQAFVVNERFYEALHAIPLPQDLQGLRRFRPESTATDAARALKEELRVMSDQVLDEPELRECCVTADARFNQLKDALERYGTAADHARRAEGRQEQATQQRQDNERLNAYRDAEDEAQRTLAQLEHINNSALDYPVADVLFQQAQHFYQQTAERRQELEATTQSVARSRRVLLEMPGLMQTGKYDEALKRAKEAVGLAPALADAQQWLDLSKLGNQRAIQAQEAIILARSQIQKGELIAARATLDALLKVDGQPLSNDPPRVVFRLPNKANAQQLLELITFIEEKESQVRNGQQQHEYAVVEQTLGHLLDRLKDFGFSLSQTQDAMLKEARGAVHKLAEVQGRLQMIKDDPEAAERTFPDWLHELLELVQANRSSAAAILRNDMAQVCLQLVERQPNLATATRMADQTLAVLPATSANELMERNRHLLAEGQALSDNLHTPPGAALPLWVSQSDWQSRFDGIVEAYGKLEKERHTLRSVDHSYAVWAEQMRTLTTTWVNTTYERVAALAEGGDFQQALADAEASWSGVPLRMREQLWVADEKRLTNLIDALHLRVQGDAIRRQAVSDLQQKKTTLPEASIRIGQAPLPYNSKVSTDDFRKAQETFRLAATHAQAADATPPQHGGKREIDDMLNRANEVDGLIPRMAASLHDQTMDQPLAQLKQRLVGVAQQIARRLCIELQNYGSLPGPDVERLVSLYTTVQQLEATVAEEVATIRPLARAAIEQTRTSLRERVDEQRQRFEQAQGAAELRDVAQNLAQISELNTHLLYALEQSPSDTQPVYNPTALRSWADGIEQLVAFDDASRAADNDATGRVQSLEHDLGQLWQRLNDLDRHVWPALFAQSWADTTAMGRLLAETESLRRLAQVSNALQDDCLHQRIPAALQRIAEPPLAQPDPTTHWLLIGDRYRLDIVLDQQQQVLHTVLGERVSTLLGLPYPSSCDRLHELIEPVSPIVAPLVSSTIEAQVAERIASLQKANAPASAIRSAAVLYWSTIAQATQPFVGSAGHAGSGVWSNLYGAATIRQRDRAWTLQQRFMIALWVIGLLLAFGSGWAFGLAF